MTAPGHALPAAGGAPPRAGKHLWDYWRIMWERRWLIAAAVVPLFVLTFVGTAYMRLRHPRYRAEVQLLMNLTPPPVLGTDVERAARLSYVEQDHAFKTEFLLIKRRELMEEAIREGDLLKKVPALAAVHDPAALLVAAVDADRVPQTSIATLTVSWSDAQNAALLANSIAQTYVDYDLKQRVADTEERAARLLASVQERARPRREVLANDIQVLRGDADLETVMKLKAASDDEALTKLRDDYAKNDQELKALLGSYGEGYQGVKEKRSEQQGIVQAITAERNALAKLLWQEYATYGGTEATLEEDAKYVRSAQQDSSSQLEQKLLDRVNEQLVYERTAEPKARIEEPARPPGRPYSPNFALNLALALVVGLGLGGGLAFFADFLDSAVRTLDDLETYIGLVPLAVVPRYTGDPPPGAREAFQTLRVGLLFASSGRRDRIVLVTSAAPGEGKTTVATNLARTLAAAGERVILVDGDLRRPSVTRALGVRAPQGLSNYLADASTRDWRSFVTEVEPRLWALGTGPVPPNPLSLLGQVRLAELLRELREAHDWVVIDSPPVSSVSDSLVLASLAEMVVVVVRHDSTDKEVVRRTCARLASVNGRIAGGVLTDVDMEKPYNREYYYGRFYSGHYYGQDPGGAGDPSASSGLLAKAQRASKRMLKG